MEGPIWEPGARVVTIPGDPEGLRHAAMVYSSVASGMARVAGTLRRSVGDVADWEGEGAEANAVRSQALAAGHQVGGDAFNFAAGALTTYAIQLEEAQEVAKQATQAWAEQAATAAQLNQVLADEAQARSEAAKDAKEFGNLTQWYTTSSPSPAPYQLDAARASQLQSLLLEQQAQATKLTNQAYAMAKTAGDTAARAFRQVAQMAGQPANHGSPDPFQAYLGIRAPGKAAAIIQAGYNLGGIPKGSDAKALADMAADPGAGKSDRQLAALYEKQNRNYTRIVAKDLSYLRHHGDKHPLTRADASLSPGVKLAVVSQESIALHKYLESHHPSGWLTVLQIGGMLLGGLSAAATIGALAELGPLDALVGPVVSRVVGQLVGRAVADDLTTVITDDAESAAADAASADGADSVGADAADKPVSPEMTKLLGNKSWNQLATALAGGGLTLDVSDDVITRKVDVIQLVGDTAAFVPGVGAFVLDLSEIAKTARIESDTVRLAETARGTDEYEQLSREIAELKTSNDTFGFLAKLLAAKSFSIGSGAFFYNAASLVRR